MNATISSKAQPNGHELGYRSPSGRDILQLEAFADQILATIKASNSTNIEDRTDAMLDEFEAECEPFRKTTLRAWVDRWICEHDDAIYAITG